MPLKTKILTVPERYQPKLREHNFKHAESWKEKIDVLGRDERGRIKPLVPKPSTTANDGQSESDPSAG